MAPTLPDGDVGEPSAGAKLGAATVGFLFFYALLPVLATLAFGLQVPGKAAAGVVAIGVLYWVVRALRGKDPRDRGTLRWAALGFAAATVVFGGCLGLIATGRIRIAG